MESAKSAFVCDCVAFFICTMNKKNKKNVNEQQQRVEYLLETDDALPGVTVVGDGEGVGSLRVDDGVFDVSIDPQVLVVGLDLPHRLADLG